MTHLPFDLQIKERRDVIVTVYTTKTMAGQIRKAAEKAGVSMTAVCHHIFEKAFEDQSLRRRRATDNAA